MRKLIYIVVIGLAFADAQAQGPLAMNDRPCQEFRNTAFSHDPIKHMPVLEIPATEHTFDVDVYGLRSLEVVHLRVYDEDGDLICGKYVTAREDGHLSTLIDDFQKSSKGDYLLQIVRKKEVFEEMILRRI